MKYVKKDFHATGVIDYKRKLKNAKLNKGSLKNPNVHPKLDGPAVFEQVKSIPSFNGLKKQMFEDQGGICCYCGKKLKYEGHPYSPQYTVEHVFPKSLDRRLAGEYRNMLLSCRPSDEENDEAKKARRGKSVLSYHCDKFKENNVLTYTPLQKDCADHFIYNINGDVVGADNDATKDIATLNLNCSFLKKRREAAIVGELYDEYNNLLSDNELANRLNTIMKRDANNRYIEFCFVIDNVIRNLLK